MRNKYEKETGLLINYCEIKISKPTKEVTYKHKSLKVLLSNDRSYVVDGLYGKLMILDKKHSKYDNSNTLVNKINCYEQRWGTKYLDDYLTVNTYSILSKKVTDTRLKKKLYAFIEKECYFYNGLTEVIEQELSKSYQLNNL